jgi:hypothetical protein
MAGFGRSRILAFRFFVSGNLIHAYDDIRSPPVHYPSINRCQPGPWIRDEFQQQLHSTPYCYRQAIERSSCESGEGTHALDGPNLRHLDPEQTLLGSMGPTVVATIGGTMPHRPLRPLYLCTEPRVSGQEVPNGAGPLDAL